MPLKSFAAILSPRLRKPYDDGFGAGASPHSRLMTPPSSPVDEILRAQTIGPRLKFPRERPEFISRRKGEGKKKKRKKRGIRPSARI